MNTSRPAAATQPDYRTEALGLTAHFWSATARSLGLPAYLSIASDGTHREREDAMPSDSWCHETGTFTRERR